MAIAGAVAALLVAGVAAQDPYNCDDFDSQFEAQTELNRTYPDDPGNLDGNGNWIACEDDFNLTDAEIARVIPADVVNRATGNDDEPAPTVVPTEAPRPAPPSGTVAIPADVMARVEGCAVIAISSRSVAAAGCPGVGAIAFSIPRDAPRMRGTVIINPGAPFTSGSETRAQRAETSNSIARAQSARPRSRNSDRAERGARARSETRAQDADDDARDRERRRERQERRGR